MERALTRGQPAAVEALTAMLRAGLPHAILLVGPGGSGKTTLALDVAAALLCTSDDAASRPCRACRACRMVHSGNHPDLHRLGPQGPGGQILIGGRAGQPPGVRDLLSELALLPVEGGARIAIVEQAHRMNEDAQSALLKTLEEPPPGVVLILCAEDEDRLVPTIHSRAARIRLAPVPGREIEALLVDHGVADAPTAARLARLSGGRPGVALSLARAPAAVNARGEIARTLLDLTGAASSRRLAGVRELLTPALAAVRSLADRSASPAAAAEGRGRSRSRTPDTVQAAPSSSAGVPDADDPGAPPGVRLSAVERRRAAGFVLDAWRDVTRDLLLARLGDLRAVHDPALLDELAKLSPALSEAALRAFLGRLAQATELLEANVSPELLLDSLILAWPRRIAAA